MPGLKFYTVGLAENGSKNRAAAIFPHRENALEFAYMAADGTTPGQSLMAGTSAALKPGLAADICGCPGDPST